MLALVAYEFETGQTFMPMQTDATLLANNTQQCCDLLRPFAWAVVTDLLYNHAGSALWLIRTPSYKKHQGGNGGKQEKSRRLRLNVLNYLKDFSLKCS